MQIQTKMIIGSGALVWVLGSLTLLAGCNPSLPIHEPDIVAAVQACQPYGGLARLSVTDRNSVARTDRIEVDCKDEARWVSITMSVPN